MIEGITLLEIIPIMEKPDWIFLVAILGIFCFIICALYINDSITIIFGFLGSLFIIICILLSLFIPSKYTGKSKYIVKIDENTNILEFLNKYEILEHEKYSNIYMIKEL